VSNLEDDNAESKELVRTILSMASNLGLGVIAEGIENLASVDLLRRLGCNFGQGFYFSRAVNAESAAAMLHEIISSAPAAVDDVARCFEPEEWEAAKYADITLQDVQLALSSISGAQTDAANRPFRIEAGKEGVVRSRRC
jgi:c-di-GMP-related signal transduction protein